jgi:hypothetical protein
MIPSSDYNALHKRLLEKGFKFLGSGKDRRVFLTPNKKYVIKLPLHEDGAQANWNEAQRWKHRRSYDKKFARCKLIPNTDILVMEYVRPRKVGEHIPRWVYGIDCLQVGYKSSGELVAYDYG